MSVLQDRRRVLPPVDTIPLQFKEDEGSSGSKETTIARTRTIRPIFIKQSVVANASGSAYLEVEDIKLQCSVYGPKPIRGSFTQQADLLVEAKLPSLGQDASNDKSASIEKDITSFVQTSITPGIILTQYPKSCINIMITVISADLENRNFKSLLAAATNVASLALVDAGIALYDIVTSASVLLSRNENGESLYFDPETPRESEDIEGVLSFMTGQDESNIVGMWLDGENITSKNLTTLTESAKEAACQIRTLFNGVILQEFHDKEQEASNSK
ncbi:Mtr3p [Sugiyamaella lignohabitans]|uniref:Mtr3p n=1 Tax=Sugiyamaella lignohabitans TaxID=796027 RepID=A0A167FML4_9ASCO|nr:Mtr3p [Sugiyamaella lignohabitans]ANB15484.1 Mtr3p [Sugiyamaella lignohabitans]